MNEKLSALKTKASQVYALDAEPEYFLEDLKIALPSYYKRLRHVFLWCIRMLKFYYDKEGAIHLELARHKRFIGGEMSIIKKRADDVCLRD